VDYYPVFLNLKGKKVVIIGGGKVAERKALSLLKAGARVTVVSPSLTRRLSLLKSGEGFSHLARAYRDSDLRGSFLVVAATDSEEVNRRISRIAPALVNVVDVPAECNFISPSVIKRGPLTIAISTSGISPALSRAIRKELEKIYGPEFSEYLRFLKKVRAKALAGVAEKKERERFLKGLASERMLKMLRSEGIAAVKEKVVGRLKKIAGKGRGNK
jgi:precorrin-2 dehydrogenase/sirohydrochlorin ferrochelatase